MPTPTPNAAQAEAVVTEAVEKLFWQWWHKERQLEDHEAAAFHAGYKTALRQHQSEVEALRGAERRQRDISEGWILAATKAEAENARLCKLIDAVQEEYWLRAGNADLDDLMNDLRQAKDAQG